MINRKTFQGFKAKSYECLCIDKVINIIDNLDMINK